MSEQRSVQILIDTTGGETRAVLREAGVVREIVIDRGQIAVGDMFWARISARRPEQESSVVTLGRGLDGFLPDATCREDVPREGDVVLVQVTRAAQGGKGPKLTARPSLEGRLVVYTPYLSEIRIGKKLLDGESRDRLKTFFRHHLGESAQGGVTLRTAGASANPEQLAEELDRLRQLWSRIRQTVPDKLPACVHSGPRRLDQMISELPPGAIDWLVVDGPASALKQRWNTVNPQMASLLQVWRGPSALFEQEGVEEDLDAVLSSEVVLKGGGRLIIEPTAALVAIDVDTGGAGYGGDAFKRRRSVNLAAAEEGSRQIKLRNLSGLIMVDVLKPGSAGERDEVLKAWNAAFDDEKSRETQVLGLSKGGVLEIVRARRAAPLHELYKKTSQTTSFTPTASAFFAARALLRQYRRDPAGGWALAVSPAIAAAFQEEAQPAWQAMADSLGRLPHLVVLPEAADDEFDLQMLRRS